MTASQRRRAPEPTWDPATQITVDHRSPVPLYYQVASQIEEAIDSGALPVGARLDNETGASPPRPFTTATS